MVMVPFWSVLGLEQPLLITAPPPGSPEPVSATPPASGGLSGPALAEALGAVLALLDAVPALLDVPLAAVLAAVLVLLAGALAEVAALLDALLDCMPEGDPALEGEPALLDCVPPLLGCALLVELLWVLALGCAPFPESLDEQANVPIESSATRGTAVRARIMVGLQGRDLRVVPAPLASSK